MIKKLLTLVIIGFALYGAYALFFQKNSAENIPPLTHEDAMTLMETVIAGGCEIGPASGEYDSCDVVVAEDEQSITATFENVRDDSVKALQMVIPVAYQFERWSADIQNITTLHQCREDRGHQDFSLEACI